MYRLRDQISDVIIKAAHEHYEPYAPPDREDVENHTDRILALIAEALLTDEAVEAGGKSVHHHFGQGNWERVTRNEAVLARWRGEDNTRPATGQYVATAKETITAALDALLGKETHDATD